MPDNNRSTPGDGVIVDGVIVDVRSRMLAMRAGRGKRQIPPVTMRLYRRNLCDACGSCLATCVSTCGETSPQDETAALAQD